VDGQQLFIPRSPLVRPLGLLAAGWLANHSGRNRCAAEPVKSEKKKKE
jgi:hypothetical protein